jgi:diadenosine tetraphosphate (Ap4A) HIT family hydrolase
MGVKRRAALQVMPPSSDVPVHIHIHLIAGRQSSVANPPSTHNPHKPNRNSAATNKAPALIEMGEVEICI